MSGLRDFFLQKLAKTVEGILPEKQGRDVATIP